MTLSLIRTKKTNYEINIFKVIENFSYNITSVVDTLLALKLDMFTPYSLKGPLLIEKHLVLFLRVLNFTAKIQI